MSNPKQILNFDPKNPPKTPIYVGQRIPIYIVPDETNDEERFKQPDWVESDLVFKIVNIRQKIHKNKNGIQTTNDFVDVEWPNGYIDKSVPIQHLYGGFTRIHKSLVHRITDAYESDSDGDDDECDGDDDECDGDDDECDDSELNHPKTNHEKLEQLLKILQFLSEQREKLNSQGLLNDEPQITIEETDQEPTVIDDILDAGSTDISAEPISMDKESILNTENLKRLLPDLEPNAIEALRDAASTTKDTTKDTAKESEKTTKKNNSGTTKKAPTITKAQITKWLKPPSKGGLSVTDLRIKCKELGIKNVGNLKKGQLKDELLKLA